MGFFLPHSQFLENNCLLCGDGTETLIPFSPEVLEMSVYFYLFGKNP